ncbi:UNVERIFIED_CONTAM: hypothetical protein FKN15_060354 [Acipenser sinensis]
MASHGHLSQNELLEVDISCDDNCSDGENDVFVNSGASYDGFPAFQQWVPATAPPTEFGQSEEGTRLFGQSAPLTRHPNQNHGSEDTVRFSSDSDGSCDTRHGGAGDTLAPRSSIVDYLLIELYDTYTCNSRKSVDSVDSSTEASGSDAFLGRSNTESNFLQELQDKQTRRHQVQYLAQKDIDELKRIIQEVNYRIGMQSAKLVRQVKRKDRLANKMQKNNDIITACLQAVSQKRRVDTRLKFTIEPSLGKNGFQQTVYSMAEFPFPHLAELREKYTYNITPFPAPGKLGKSRDSDEEIDIDDEDSLVSAVGCLGPFSGLLATELQRYQKHLTAKRLDCGSESGKIKQGSCYALWQTERSWIVLT